LVSFIGKFFIGAVAVGFVPSALALAFGLLNSFHPLADSASHFRLHLTTLMAVAMIAFLLAMAWRWASIALLATVLGIAGLWRGLPSTVTVQSSAPEIRMVQFNTLFKNPKPEVSTQWINDQTPDIVTLQEVSTNTMAIFDKLSVQMRSSVTCKFAGIGGVAILSKFPKVAEKCIEGQGLVWMQVMAHGKPVTVASLHLHWPYPYRQWQQIDNLKAEFKAMPRPVVLAGDFNAAPWSEAVRRVTEATSTELKSGTRFTLRMGAYGFGPYAVLPIDHVLFDASATDISVNVGPPIGSDHLALFARFRMDQGPQ
jgi:endonuclease/exonuclease/phosphatase (EEP) superfamily protein YafD